MRLSYSYLYLGESEMIVDVHRMQKKNKKIKSDNKNPTTINALPSLLEEEVWHLTVLVVVVIVLISFVLILWNYFSH